VPGSQQAKRADRGARRRRAGACQATYAKRLRRGLATWRRLGLRRGATAALATAWSPLGGALRRTHLRLRPLRAGSRTLARALGGAEPARALRELALPALPTVAAWERELDELDAAARADLLERAEQVLAHRFDLLGSGPSDLGPRIDWQLDFKSGRRWPDAHISRIERVYGDGSDIKVPWELGRCQHLPLLAAAHRVSGERRFLDELGAQLCSFIEANPVEYGATWACTMDVAIRAANWLAAMCMTMPAAADEPWLEQALASLLLHCRFIRTHLEWGTVRGNHYLSDVVGLLVACAPFTGSVEGRAWAAWATRELEREMAHQVRADGCDHEASIAYHRLVCELFVCGEHAADALCPGTLSSAFRERLGLMLQFVCDYTRPDGLAPQVGDADDGRFLPLGGYKADPRDHRHLHAQARPLRGQEGCEERPAGRERSAGWHRSAEHCCGADRQSGVDDHRHGGGERGHAAYPDGGWYVMRHGPMWAIVRCGDVGLGGGGGHAHNDQLSFELAYGEQPLVVDPGSYLYTADARARNEFRSTRAHSTLAIDGAEQNRLRSDYLFAMPEETHARCLHFTGEGPRANFEGEHSGFRELSRPVRHRRRLRFDGQARIVRIEDTACGARGSQLLWSFPFAPAEVRVEAGRALATFAAVQLLVQVEGASLELEQGWLSPSYGVRVPTPVLRARRIASSDEDCTRFTLTIQG
jgi:hypothetical protein